MNARDPLSPAPQSSEVSTSFVPGEWNDMPAEYYHAVEAMSYSGAKKILRSPAHYKLARETPNEPTDAMQFGTAVHCGVLEPDCFAERVVIAPSVNKRTNAGKEELANFEALNFGRLILSPHDFQRARRCVDAVRAHPAASRLLTGAKVEGSLFWFDAEYGVPCKMRFDARNLGGIVDLKTAQDASPDEFGRQAAKLLYHVQAAHYWSGSEHVFNEAPTFFAFVVVESEPPHAVACYVVPPIAMQTGRRLMDEALARYKAALAAGKWVGYPDTITTLELPRYAVRFDI